MGRRGPAKQPLKLLRAKGSRKAEGRSEVELPAGLPKAPHWLNETEHAVWKDVCELLGPVGIVTRADSIILQALAVAYRVWRDAYDLLNQDGLTQETEVGTSPNPAVKIEREARKDLSVLCREFGITPASRADVSGSLPQTKNSKAEFFKMG